LYILNLLSFNDTVVALIAKHQMEGLLVNTELKKVWKELIVV